MINDPKQLPFLVGPRDNFFGFSTLSLDKGGIETIWVYSCIPLG